jgi:hypothetical protein
MVPDETWFVMNMIKTRTLGYTCCTCLFLFCVFCVMYNQVFPQCFFSHHLPHWLYYDEKNQGFTRSSIMNKTIDWLNIYFSGDNGIIRTYITQLIVTPDDVIICWKIYIESINCFIHDTWPSEFSIFITINLRQNPMKWSLWLTCLRNKSQFYLHETKLK